MIQPVSRSRTLRWVAGILLTAGAGVVHAVPIIVDTAHDNLVPGDGLCTLREAIDNANWDADLTSGDCEPGLPGPDVVRIQPGLPTIVLNGTELQVRRAMSIIGPEGGQTIDANQASRVLHVRMDMDPAGTHDYRIENLNLANGFVSSPSFGSPLDCAGRGAGLCMSANSVSVARRAVIRHVHLTGNRTVGDASHGGGAYFGNTVVDVVVTSSRWQGNDAGGAGAIGGGVYFDGVARVTMSDVRIQGNTARLEAGGIAAANAMSFVLARANLSNNQARFNNPSALSVTNAGSIILQDTLVQANLNVDDSLNLTHAGYAVRMIGNPGAVASVANTWIDQNLGCGLLLNVLEGYVSGTTISRNSCIHEGVALRVIGANVNVSGSSIIDNTGPFGAVRVAGSGARLVLESSTVVGNQATNPGEAGGVRLDEGTLVLRSAILAENAGMEGSFERLGAGARIDASTSQFGDAPAEINGTSTGNLFQGTTNVGPLGDHGCATAAGDSVVGPVQCVGMRPLSANSPAIDQGQSHGAAYDQRGPGFMRVFGSGADIGAYEFQSPQVSIEAVDATRTEGGSGLTAFDFRIRRNGDTRDESFASWNLSGSGTHAADAADFSAQSWIGGTAYFAPGIVEVPVTIQVVGDTTPEFNERFSVTLGTLTNGTPGAAASASGEIINDDGLFPVATLSIAALQTGVDEGQYFHSAHRFRVTRAQVTTGFCTFDVALVASGGTFGADAADFQGVVPGVLNTYQMSPGTTQADIEIRVAGDGLLEFDESFELRLQNASGCFIDSQGGVASGMIVNDDSSIWVETVTAMGPEGTGADSGFSFLIRRGTTDVNAASVRWSVSGQGANPASPDDFAGGAFPAAIAVFAPGQDEVLVVVTVAGDSTIESDEGFRMTLSDPDGGGIAPTGIADAVIVNDDGLGNTLFGNGFE